MKCHCKKGTHRDNCSDCEGTGVRIDFHTMINFCRRCGFPVDSNSHRRACADEKPINDRER